MRYGPSIILDPGAAARVLESPRTEPVETRRISCIMASRGRLFPAAHAIHCFRRQTYEDRELVIATGARDGILRDYVAGLGDGRIRVIDTGDLTPGALRNIAIAAATGDLLCVWDDDDLAHPQRLSVQAAQMAAAGARACFLARLLLWSPAEQRLAISGARIWENSMLGERRALLPYPEAIFPGEDTVVAEALRRSHRLVLADVPDAYCYVVHGQNACSPHHFERLFDAAAQHFVGSDYAEALDLLDGHMPIAAYAAATDGG